MQQLALLMIVTVTTCEYLAVGDFWGRGAILPRSAQYLPELLGAVALICVILGGIRNRFAFVRPAYWIVFGALGVAITAGVVVNGVDSGPIFAGLRTYLRAIPWFFVAAAFAFSDKQVRTQLRWLTAICFLQLPLAIDQRMQTAAHAATVGGTGDLTTGTLLDSGTLSLFLVGAICVTAALALRKLLTKKQSLLLFILLLVPTTINETKATIVFLPIGILMTFLSASRPGTRVKQLVLAVAMLAFFLAVFVPTYDAIQRANGNPGVDYYLDSKNTEKYLLSDKDVGSEGPVGRGTAVIVPVRETLQDPVRATFGVGIGNASSSALGKKFTGRFNGLYENFLITGFTRIILELGFLGFGLLIMVYWLIFQDSRVVARKGQGDKAAVAAAWAGITVLMGLALFYIKPEVSSALSFLFWYFSGLIAAERMRLTLPQESQRRALAPAPEDRALDGGRSRT